MRAASFVNRGNNSASPSSPRFHEFQWETIKRVYTNTQSGEVTLRETVSRRQPHGWVQQTARGSVNPTFLFQRKKFNFLHKNFLIKYTALILTMTKLHAERGRFFLFWLTSLVYIGFYFPFLMRRSVYSRTKNFAVWKLKRSKEIYIIRF